MRPLRVEGEPCCAGAEPVMGGQGGLPGPGQQVRTRRPVAAACPSRSDYMPVTQPLTFVRGDRLARQQGRESDAEAVVRCTPSAPEEDVSVPI